MVLGGYPRAGQTPPRGRCVVRIRYCLSGFADDVGIGRGHSLRLHELDRIPVTG